MKRKDIPTISVLKAYKKMEDTVRGKFVDEILMEEFNAPEKLVYSAINRDYDKGFIEFGVSIRSGWLTESGEKYLNEHTHNLF